MARKEPFTPIWNYDDSGEKNGRKKATIKELDRERGKRAEPDRELPEPKKYGGMFEADRASHHMTKRKEKAIAVIAVIVFLAIIVCWFILRTKWQREMLSSYMASPQNAWSVSCMRDASQGDAL